MHQLITMFKTVCWKRSAYVLATILSQRNNGADSQHRGDDSFTATIERTSVGAGRCGCRRRCGAARLARGAGTGGFARARCRRRGVGRGCNAAGGPTAQGLRGSRRVGGSRAGGNGTGGTTRFNREHWRVVDIVRIRIGDDLDGVIASGSDRGARGPCVGAGVRNGSYRTILVE